MTVWYAVEVRDSNGNLVTGLRPGWLWCRRLDTRTPVPPPPIDELGPGVYRFPYDAEATGDFLGVIDVYANAAESMPSMTALNQYVVAGASRESSVILSRPIRVAVS